MDCPEQPPPPPYEPPPPVPYPLPSGFKFLPDDDELIRDYLVNKILNLPIPCDYAVVELNIYNHIPEDFCVSFYFLVTDDQDFHLNFYVLDVVTDDQGIIIGTKRTLVYYQGSRNSGTDLRTSWIMNEYMSSRPV
ncbi:hypothetical protein LIER_04199 [Lithospermum erythrorhizon]|uniref:NAC domain-containing protein n=1 Tax=Lithospermum erythrorhizon TaxID=34254 RepID=A0AAV3NX87_LITER